EATGDGSADPVQLRKALEWELSLDCRDLRSHAWYHGAIPRGRAEEIVRELGQFLVRDCTSQPGNYVLTCRTPTAPLHFVISKVRSFHALDVFGTYSHVLPHITISSTRSSLCQTDNIHSQNAPVPYYPLSNQ
ncbi:hypothetical protein AAG570_001564, partial [Ranatra chinensis]